MKRQKQGQTLKDWDFIVKTLPKIAEDVRKLIIRGRYTPGEKSRQKGELGVMDGTPAPHYGDPTGEDAAWNADADNEKRPQEIPDPMDGIIATAAEHVRHLLNSVKQLAKETDTDVRKRAERTVPDCMACGDPVPGKVRAGFDDKCYTRWLRAKRPDRAKFISGVRAERAAKAERDTSVPSVPPSHAGQ